MRSAPLDFQLPADLSADRPPEARGLDRDEVQLLVAAPTGIEHTRFTEITRFLDAGDVLVVNTSATLPAAVAGLRRDGRSVFVHFSTALDDGTWVVELRGSRRATGPLTDVSAGELVDLPGGVQLRLLDAYPPTPLGTSRLWRVKVAPDDAVLSVLGRHGRPITYAYVPDEWPLAAYQTVFAADPGSAEMPSAGRPFTERLVASLVRAGVVVTPVTLHTGVSSADKGEAPAPERFVVPQTTARAVNAARQAGRRVVAVGTTATRALETVAGSDGMVEPGGGLTDLVLGIDRPARVVNGLVTGWHTPGASHLRLLEAVAGPSLVAQAYREGLRKRYLWHEFGDSCLLLPGG